MRTKHVEKPSPKQLSSQDENQPVQVAFKTPETDRLADAEQRFIVVYCYIFNLNRQGDGK